MRKYDFTCIFVVQRLTFVQPLSFLCEIKKVFTESVMHTCTLLHIFLDTILKYTCWFGFSWIQVQVLGFSSGGKFKW